MPTTPTPRPTGDAVLRLAQSRDGDAYVFGARAPMANADYTGPWDCAEFCSWCVHQVSGILFGVEPTDDAMRADAYTGYWVEQALAHAATIPITEAVRIPGACLLRAPLSSRTGHIAFSDGGGGTMEAHSTRRGVIAHTAAGRRWDYGVLVPGIAYYMAEDEITLPRMPHVLRLTAPMTRGPRVQRVQEALVELGYALGAVDGIYGPQTESAVIQFQNASGLVPDGEVGPDTLRYLGLA